MKNKIFNNIIYTTKDKVKGEIFMELVKNIFFNTDKIVENMDVKITYAGKLFQNGSEFVTLHYGFGDNWENAKDVNMVKTELGFQTFVHVQNNSKLGFCFRNEKGEWDNNDGKNYSFVIEKSVNQENAEEIKQNEQNQQQWQNNMQQNCQNSQNVQFKSEQNIQNQENQNIQENLNNQNVQNNWNGVQESQALLNSSPSWFELIKKTFNNLVKHISKLFSSNKQNVKNED